MSDPITPPLARWPLEAAELVSLAVSDGDLGAAIAQYERGAPLLPWAEHHDQENNDQEGDRRSPLACLPGGGQLPETMAAIMRLRLPLELRLVTVLPADGLTMLVCERRIDGMGPDGATVRLHGTGCTVVRQHPDGSWRIAADAWQLAVPPAHSTQEQP